MDNFDEVKLVVTAHLVLKKGKSKEESKRIHSRIQEILESWYPTENVKVEIIK